MNFFNLIVCVNTMTSMIKTDPFFDLIDFQVQRVFLHVGLHGNPRNVFRQQTATLLDRPRLHVQSIDTFVGLGRRGRDDHCRARCGYRTVHDQTRTGTVYVTHMFGCTCDVTSSTDQIMNIHARITLNVECIRTCIFLF